LSNAFSERLSAETQVHTLGKPDSTRDNS
jgi:hypothetical protein